MQKFSQLINTLHRSFSSGCLGQFSGDILKCTSTAQLGEGVNWTYVEVLITIKQVIFQILMI